MRRASRKIFAQRDWKQRQDEEIAPVGEEHVPLKHRGEANHRKSQRGLEQTEAAECPDSGAACGPGNVKATNAGRVKYMIKNPAVASQAST